MLFSGFFAYSKKATIRPQERYISRVPTTRSIVLPKEAVELNFIDKKASGFLQEVSYKIVYIEYCLSTCLALVVLKPYCEGGMGM